MSYEITKQTKKLAESLLPASLLDRLIHQSNRGWPYNGIIVFDRVANTGKKSDNVWSMFSSEKEAKKYYEDLTGKIICPLKPKGLK